MAASHPCGSWRLIWVDHALAHTLKRKKEAEMRIIKNAHPLTFAIALMVTMVVGVGLAGSGSAGAAPGRTAVGSLPDLILPGHVLPRVPAVNATTREG
jgi:hypothetical protein